MITSMPFVIYLIIIIKYSTRFFPVNLDMVVLQHGSTTKELQGLSVWKVCQGTFLAQKFTLGCIAKSHGYEEISFEIVISVSKSGARHYVWISERCDLRSK